MQQSDDTQKRLEEQQKIQEIAEKFKKEFEENPQKFVDEYRKKFDNHLTPDNALELCKEYKENPDLRLKLDNEIRETASQIRDEVRQNLLQEKPNPDKNLVVFITSGSGSGKTFATKELKEPLKERADVVDEVIYGLNEKKIDEALSTGRDVAIIYVHRPIEKATEGIIERAEKGEHIPDLKYHSEGHYYCQQNFLRLAEKYKDNPKVDFGIVNNSGNKKDIRFIDDREKAVEFVKNNAYTSIEEVKERAFRSYENVREQREQQGQAFRNNIKSALFPNGERAFQEEISRVRGDVSRELETERSQERGRGRSEEAEKREQINQPSQFVSDASLLTEPKRIFESKDMVVDRISEKEFLISLPNGKVFFQARDSAKYEAKFLKHLENSESRQNYIKDLERLKIGENTQPPEPKQQPIQQGIQPLTPKF